MIEPAPSREYLDALEAAKTLHANRKVYDGLHTSRVTPTLRWLCQKYQAKTLLDYGCGKGLQLEDKPINLKLFGVHPNLKTFTGVDEIVGFDPAWPQFAEFPEGRVFDGVYCVDVLRLIPLQDWPWVLARMASTGAKFILIGEQHGVHAPDKPHGDARSRKHGRNFHEGLWLISQSVPEDLDVVVCVRHNSHAIGTYYETWRREGRVSSKWQMAPLRHWPEAIPDDMKHMFKPREGQEHRPD